MAFKRTAIPFFELANGAYASSEVSFFAVNATTFAREATLITLYAGKTGATTLTNPITLDSDGKFSVPVYAEERTIAVVSDTDGQQHETGVFEPSLSDADVTAAAASATAAASSASEAQTAEEGAEDAQEAAELAKALAEAALALAIATIGSLKVTSNDSTPRPLASKLTAAASSGISLAEQNDAGDETLAAALSFTGMTALTTPDDVDVGPVYDDSGIAHKKITLANLLVAGWTAITSIVDADTILGLQASSGLLKKFTIGNLLAHPAIAAITGTSTATITSGTTAMTARRRYRITGGTGTIPTLDATDSWVIVECAPAAGTTVTMGRNSQTINGNAADHTYMGDGGSGPIMLYSYISAGAIRATIIGSTV